MITKEEKIELYEILEDCRRRAEFMGSLFLSRDADNHPARSNDMEGFYDLNEFLIDHLEICMKKLDLD